MIWSINILPKSINDYELLQPKFYQIAKVYSIKKDMPHLLLVGKDGVGKTTAAYTLAKSIVIEANIKIVYVTDPITKEEAQEAKESAKVSSSRIGSSSGMEKKVNPFIQQRIIQFVTSPKVGSDPFKILIIRDFDKLGREQNAMRRIMEKYAKTCRIILTADQLSNVIDPILSRCQIINFPMYEDEDFDEIITEMMKETSNIDIKKDTAEALRKASGKNIGKAMNIAQLSYCKNKSLTPSVIMGNSRDEMLIFSIELMQNIFKGRISRIIQDIDAFVSSNYFEWRDFVKKLLQYVIKLEIDTILKQKIILKIAEKDSITKDRNGINFYIYDLAISLNTIITNKG